MTFRNPIIGGDGTLVRQAMQSEGFVSGSTGWRIERDGTAEFNGATFRGNVVLDGTGTLLVYDDDGVIIAAISPSGGTDPAGSGQTYQPGIDTYAQSGGSPTYEVNIRDGFIVFNYVSGTLFKQRGLIQANEPLDAGTGPSLGMYAPSDNSDQRQAAVVCFGTSADGSDEHHVSITGLDPLNSNALVPTTVNVNGDLNVSGDINLPQGSYVRRGGMATPTFQNGWGNYGAPFQPVRYIEYPDGTGGLTGVANGGTTTGGTVLFTLPAQVRPGADHVFTVPSTSGKHAQIVVRANGQVALQNPDSGITWLGLSGCRWPLAAF